jgi:hypothetical protein
MKKEKLFLDDIQPEFGSFGISSPSYTTLNTLDTSIVCMQDFSSIKVLTLD